jgi:hypothetical protein
MATAQQRQWIAGDVNRFQPAKPTKFEIVVRQLRLENDPKAWPISNSLRMWAKKHRNTHYIPENLLAVWDIEVLFDD